MFLWRLLLTDPIMALALCLCLATICGCIYILRRRQKGPDRFLATLLGLVSVWQGLRILREAGIIGAPGTPLLHGFADFILPALYLAGVLIIRISAIDRKNTEVCLRLVEANGPAKLERFDYSDSSGQALSEILLGANPLATVATDRSGLVIYWNPAAERLVGWKAEEVLGKANPLPLGSPIPTKAGKTIAIESWVSTLRDRAGNPCGTVLVMAPSNADAPAGQPIAPQPQLGLAANILEPVRG